MSWTPAASNGNRALHPSGIGVLSEHRESTGLCRSHPVASDPVGKDSPRFAYLFSCRSTPFFTTFAHRLRAERGDARAHSRERKWAHSVQFWYNVSPLDATLVDPFVCVANKGLAAIPKSRRCNTYKKHRGGGPVMVSQTSGEGCLSRATIGNEGSLFTSDCRFRPCWKAFFPRQSLGLLLTLFTTRAFHKSFPFSGIRTLSKNSRVYGFSSRSGTRHSSLATSFASSTHSRGRPSNRRKLNHAVS